MEYGETVEHAAIRELEEETGIVVGTLRLIGVYSDPARDPRGHYVSVAFLAEFPPSGIPKAGDAAASAEFMKDWQKLNFAFDHKKILDDALKLRDA